MRPIIATIAVYQPIAELRAMLLPDDLNRPDIRGNTLLHFAAMANRIDLLNDLLQRDQIKLLIRNGQGYTALDEAKRRNHTEAVTLIENKLEHLAGQEILDILNTDFERNHPGEAAILADNRSLVSQIASELACQSSLEQAPILEAMLLTAVLHQKTHLLTAIMTNNPYCGQSINSIITTSLGDAIQARESLLHKAVEQGAHEVIELLLKNAADRYQNNHRGRNPLMAAVSKGCFKTVKLLLSELSLEQRSDYTNQYMLDPMGEITVLYIAVGKGHLDILKYLVEECGANIRHKLARQLNILHMAASDERFDMIDYLLSKAPDLLNALEIRGLSALHVAADQPCIKSLTRLAEWGGNVNTKNKDGDAPLHTVVKSGYFSVLKVLINCGADINIKDKQGCSPLHLAVKKGRVDLVVCLLNNGADPNALTDKHETPLLIAACQGHKGIVHRLLPVTADINQRDIEGRTVLSWAAQSHQLAPEILMNFLAAGASLDVMDREGLTPIQIAIKHATPYRCKPNILQSVVIFNAEHQNNLLDQGQIAFKNSEEFDDDVGTCSNKLQEVVQQFFSDKQDPFTAEDYAWVERYSDETHDLLVSVFSTAFDVAFMKYTRTLLAIYNQKMPELLKSSLQYVLDENEKALEGTLLSRFPPKVYRGYYRCTHLLDQLIQTPVYFLPLFRRFSDIEIEDEIQNILDQEPRLNQQAQSRLRNLKCSLVAIIDWIDKDICDLLNSRGFDLTTILHHGSTPLHAIVASRRADVLEELLTKTNKGINRVNSDGATPFYVATEVGHIPTLEILMRFGADPTRAAKNGMTPLMRVISQGPIALIPLLLADQRVITSLNCAIDNHGRTAFMRVVDCDDMERALLYSDLNLLRRLYDAGVQLELTDSQGMTALSMAVSKQQSHMVDFLLTNKGILNHIDIVDSNGQTALMMAAASGHEAILNTLIDGGANLNLVDVKGFTALMRAVQNQQVKIVQILLDRGADPTVINQENQSALMLASSHQGMSDLLLSNAGNAWEMTHVIHLLFSDPMSFTNEDIHVINSRTYSDEQIQRIQLEIKRSLLRSGLTLFDFYLTIKDHVKVPCLLKRMVMDLVDQQEQAFSLTMLNYFIACFYGIPEVDKDRIDVLLKYDGEDEHILAIVARQSVQSKSLWQYDGDDEKVKSVLDNLLKNAKESLEPLFEASGKSWAQFLELKDFYQQQHYQAVFLKQWIENPDDFLTVFDKVRERPLFKNNLEVNHLAALWVLIIEQISDNEAILFNAPYRNNMRSLKHRINSRDAFYFETWIKTNKVISKLFMEEPTLTMEDQNYIQYNPLNQQLIYQLLKKAWAISPLNKSDIKARLNNWPEKLRQIILAIFEKNHTTLTQILGTYDCLFEEQAVVLAQIMPADTGCMRQTTAFFLQIIEDPVNFLTAFKQIEKTLLLNDKRFIDAIQTMLDAPLLLNRSSLSALQAAKFYVDALNEALEMPDEMVNKKRKAEDALEREHAVPMADVDAMPMTTVHGSPYVAAKARLFPFVEQAVTSSVVDNNTLPSKKSDFYA